MVNKHLFMRRCLLKTQGKMGNKANNTNNLSVQKQYKDMTLNIYVPLTVRYDKICVITTRGSVAYLYI